MVVLASPGCAAQDHAPIPAQQDVADNPDAQVLEQLRDAGSDLTKPHPVQFFLYFPTEASAREAAGQIGELYQITVDRAADGPDWLVLAERSLVPTLSAFTEARERFEAVALRLGGEYDGWGAGVVR